MLSFSSATGNLFNRLGKIGLLLSQMRSYQLAQLTNMTDTTNGVVAQYNAESDLQAEMGSAYIGILNGVGSIGGTCQQLASDTINRMCFRDNPQISQTLQSVNLLVSINEVIRQMKIEMATVYAPVVTATPTGFTGYGNAVVVASVNRPSDGVVVQNAFSENLLLVCSQDSYSGSAIAGNEGITLTGTGQQTDFFAFNWPLGSNATLGMNVIDGNTDDGRGNLLTNSGFENWTNNTPNNWVIGVGAAGVNIFEETSLNYDGLASLRITGDAPGTLTQINQVFNSSNGTLGTLSPSTQYGVCLFLRRDGIAAGAGTLVVELVDQNGNQILDNNNPGVANSFSIDLTALTINYASYTGVFRTPAIMPSSAFIRLRLSVALTNGRSIYVDKLSMGLMSQAYTSGPFLSVHAGSIPLLAGSYATCNIVNSMGVGGTLNTFQVLFNRLYSMQANDLLLPSSATPTISDSALIA